MGRMFGSTRFMAPEEHTLGAPIDERTTVFTLGRAIQELLPGAADRVLDVASHACEAEPNRRFQSVAQFYDAWSGQGFDEWRAR
jgi:serine/threonine-protein kinase